LGQTYYKGTDGSPAPDDISSDGTITVNTVGPDGDSFDNPSITFTGNPAGSFGSGSTYNLYSAVKGYDDSGTFSGTGPAGSFTNVYSGTDQSEEHIHLDLVDSVDSAEAKSDYYLQFHNAIENWQNTGSTNLPIDYGDDSSSWLYIDTNFNDNPAPSNYTLTQSYSYTDSDSATDGAEATVSDEIFGAAVQANESVTIGTQTTYTVAATVEIPAAPYTAVALYVAPSGTQYNGTFDNYIPCGFAGTVPWTCTKYNGGYSPYTVEVGTYAH
jgi:hypothetical protein